MINKKTTIALAASAALTAGFALSPMTASADTNPFASAELSSGYMQLAEGNCGANKDAEAKCGANKVAHEDGKKAEGKCGEAKCGANKKAGAEADKTSEAKCGANKKAEEGSCGAKK